MENQEFRIIEKRPDGSFVMAPKKPRLDNVENTTTDPLMVESNSDNDLEGEEDLEAEIQQLHGRNIYLQIFQT